MDDKELERAKQFRFLLDERNKELNSLRHSLQKYQGKPTAKTLTMKMRIKCLEKFLAEMRYVESE